MLRTLLTALALAGFATLANAGETDGPRSPRLPRRPVTDDRPSSPPAARPLPPRPEGVSEAGALPPGEARRRIAERLPEGAREKIKERVRGRGEEARPDLLDLIDEWKAEGLTRDQIRERLATLHDRRDAPPPGGPQGGPPQGRPPRAGRREDLKDRTEDVRDRREDRRDRRSDGGPRDRLEDLRDRRDGPPAGGERPEPPRAPQHPRHRRAI